MNLRFFKNESIFFKDRNLTEIFRFLVLCTLKYYTIFSPRNSNYIPSRALLCDKFSPFFFFFFQDDEWKCQGNVRKSNKFWNFSLNNVSSQTHSWLIILATAGITFGFGGDVIKISYSITIIRYTMLKLN